MEITQQPVTSFVYNFPQGLWTANKRFGSKSGQDNFLRNQFVFIRRGQSIASQDDQKTKETQRMRRRSVSIERPAPAVTIQKSCEPIFLPLFLQEQGGVSGGSPAGS